MEEVSSVTRSTGLVSLPASSFRGLEGREYSPSAFGDSSGSRAGCKRRRRAQRAVPPVQPAKTTPANRKEKYIYTLLRGPRAQRGKQGGKSVRAWRRHPHVPPADSHLINPQTTGAMPQDAGGRVIIFQDNGLGVLQNVGAPDPLVGSTLQAGGEWVESSAVIFCRGHVGPPEAR